MSNTSLLPPLAPSEMARAAALAGVLRAPGAVRRSPHAAVNSRRATIDLRSAVHRWCWLMLASSLSDDATYMRGGAHLPLRRAAGLRLSAAASRQGLESWFGLEVSPPPGIHFREAGAMIGV